MTVGCSRGVNRVLKAETLDYHSGTKIEETSDCFSYIAIFQAFPCGAIGVDIDADGLGDADSIGNLDKHLLRNTGSDHILCDVTGSISAAAVDFRRVFSGEGSTAVGAPASVSVYDDFTSGKTGIAMRATNHELPGRVDMEKGRSGDVLSREGNRTEKCCSLCWESGLYPGNQDVPHVLSYL